MLYLSGEEQRGLFGPQRVSPRFALLLQGARREEENRSCGADIFAMKGIFDQARQRRQPQQDCTTIRRRATLTLPSSNPHRWAARRHVQQPLLRCRPEITQHPSRATPCRSRSWPSTRPRYDGTTSYLPIPEGSSFPRAVRRMDAQVHPPCSLERVWPAERLQLHGAALPRLGAPRSGNRRIHAFAGAR